MTKTNRELYKKKYTKKDSFKIEKSELNLDLLEKLNSNKKVRKVLEHQNFKLNSTELLGFGRIELNLMDLIEHQIYTKKDEYNFSEGNPYILKKCYNLVYNKFYLLEYDTNQKKQLIPDMVQDIKLYLYEEYFIKGIHKLDTWTISRICYRIASKTVRSNLNYSSYNGVKKSTVEYDNIFKDGRIFTEEEEFEGINDNWIKQVSHSAEHDYFKGLEEKELKKLINAIFHSSTGRQKKVINDIMDSQPKRKGVRRERFMGNDKKSIINKIDNYFI